MSRITNLYTLWQVRGKFNEDGECSDERTDKRITKMVNELIWYGSAIANKKEKDGLPEWKLCSCSFITSKLKMY